MRLERDRSALEVPLVLGSGSVGFVVGPGACGLGQDSTLAFVLNPVQEFNLWPLL